MSAARFSIIRKTVAAVALCALAFVACDRNRDPPFEVAGDGAIMEALFEDAEREIDDVLAPVGLVGRKPVFHAGVVFAEAKEEMLGVS